MGKIRILALTLAEFVASKPLILDIYIFRNYVRENESGTLRAYGSLVNIVPGALISGTFQNESQYIDNCSCNKERICDHGENKRDHESIRFFTYNEGKNSDGRYKKYQQ